MTEGIARQHLRLEPALGAHEHRLQLGPRLEQRLREGEGGHEVAACPSSREQDLHRDGECGMRNVECGM